MALHSFCLYKNANKLIIKIMHMNREASPLSWFKYNYNSSRFQKNSRPFLQIFSSLMVTQVHERTCFAFSCAVSFTLTVGVGCTLPMHFLIQNIPDSDNSRDQKLTNRTSNQKSFHNSSPTTNVGSVCLTTKVVPKEMSTVRITENWAWIS